MPKTKISEFSSTPANNTDIDSINIAEGCAPSGINDAIRELMAQLKDWQSGTSNDPMVIGSSGSLTLNQGTANGVTYLNGSKVVTSGSALVFDGSNLGLGVTPSAWGGSYKALQFASGAIAGFSTTSLDIYGNAYDSGAGAWKYQNSSQGAVRYAFYNGQHQWYNAPSGTAGNAITFTQAMTLDASGRLAIGQTSGTQRLTVNSSMDVTDGTVTTRLSQAGGAALIGTTTNHAFFFMTNDTERARIDSSGNLLVGTTSLDAKIGVVQTANTEGIYVTANNGSYTDNVLRLDCTRNTTNSSYNFLECTVPGVSNRLFIRDSGNVVNANNSYGAISDAKLKENVTDATPKLEKLNQVRVVNFNMKGDMQKQIGVIAQELEQIFPGMVEETPDRDEEGNGLGTTTKSVKYSVFVPMLIKAIQEQQAIIDSLKARLDAANL